MKEIAIDIETYSGTDLSRSGVYRYCEDPDFEILLFGYSVDDSPVQVIDLACGEKIPEEILRALTDTSVIKTAHNAHFERVCLSEYLHRTYPELLQDRFISPVGWHCTMISAVYLTLPFSLKQVGEVLKLDKQKMDEGKALIKYFCVPCSPTKSNEGRTRNRPKDDPDRWNLFKEYNVRDVETEMAIKHRLRNFPVPESVWEEYVHDQLINDRGILIDTELARKAIEIDQESRQYLEAEIIRLTGMKNPNSVLQMKYWLQRQGVQVDELGKKTVYRLLETTSGTVRQVLELRLQLSKSSIKKYQAMEECVCKDGRAHGMFQFFGASRTGRFAGRHLQLQNLPRNNLKDLDGARNLVKFGDYETVFMLYDSVPDVLSQLIRTALIPQPGNKFIVCDYSAIEARVLSWLAGETWRMDVFKNNGDIYCATASRMFHVPVEKHGQNAELRQKGKQAELACIAEGSLVLTQKGLVPIEKITAEHLLWDGESWVKHDGVVYQGEKEVITYGGLTATSDHLVYVVGEKESIQFGLAAASGAHLIQTGDSWKAIWLGENNQPGEAVEQEMEPLLCSNTMYRLWKHPMAMLNKFVFREIQRLSALFSAKTNTKMAGKKTDSGKDALRESKRSRIPQLRCKGNQIQLSECNRSWTSINTEVRTSGSEHGNRQDRYERGLFNIKSPFFRSQDELHKSAQECTQRIRTALLALLQECSDTKTVCRKEQGRDHSGCENCCKGKAKALAVNRGKARVYDVRNAGPNHRYTVSGKLVHNCGYGGAVGALKAMGALESGMKEEELKPLVESWREANPKIVQFWWAVDHAIKDAVRAGITSWLAGMRFSQKDGLLSITLPSERQMFYIHPHFVENGYGGTSIAYEGLGMNKKWCEIESYGPKFVENITQAISRDILCHAIRQLSSYRIVAHVHDEVVIECPMDTTIEEIKAIMTQTPPWAEGLFLNADGYACMYYRKD